MEGLIEDLDGEGWHVTYELNGGATHAGSMGWPKLWKQKNDHAPALHHAQAPDLREVIWMDMRTLNVRD